MQINGISRYSVLTLVFLFTAAGCSTKWGATPEPKAEAKPAEVEAKPVEKPKVAPKPVVKEEEDLEVVAPVQVAEPPKVQELPGDTAESADVAAPKRELPTDPNTFLIELINKDKTHPNFGKGHQLGFAVNGVQGGHIIVKRGQTYTFQVRTDPKHDFYISTSPVGWGAAVFTNGIARQFTYNGDVEFKPGKETPDRLYYQCRNHQSMGGMIVVVDANADIAKVEAELSKEREQAMAQATHSNHEQVSAQQVKQKISYAGMLLQFKGKGLDAAQKSSIESLIAQAKQAESKADTNAAFDLANQAVAMFSKAPQSGPTEEELAEMRGEYEGVLASVSSFEEAHDAAMKNAQKEKRKTVDFDRKAVAKLLAEADGLANDKKYDSAIKTARQAERLVASALNEMLGSQTIVYELKFDTPQEEYEYEVKRYDSYLELIPVAIEVKNPAEGSKKLMQTYVDKGQFYREKAEESAKAGRWKEAIVVIQDATKEVRRGLMILGVNM